MFYSVRMRAAKGGAHENGGKHISGAERLLTEAALEDAVHAMLRRAQSHSRGKADFINIKVEAVDSAAIKKVPLLPMKNFPAVSIEASRKTAAQLLTEHGISRAAVNAAFSALLDLRESMRGAILMDMTTGKRVDSREARGVRVSRMDVGDETGFLAFLQQQGLSGSHVREALVLAAKVAACPDIAGELCWSDDPCYTTGYVCTGGFYHRIAPLKELGDERGGRVFFVRPSADLTHVVHYLEKQPVLISWDQAETEQERS